MAPGNRSVQSVDELIERLDIQTDDNTRSSRANTIRQTQKMLQIPKFKTSFQNIKSDMDQNDASAGISANNNAKTLALPPALRAMTATFNTAELLEQILTYLPATQLLRAKATCRNFHNAIVASPTLRRKMSTYLLLNDVDEKDLFRTDAGGDVVYPIKDLQPLAFFYPEDAERRLFVRFTTNADRVGLLRSSSGFGRLRVVDQVVGDAVVGWHCSCFTGGRAEAQLCIENGMVTFGDLLGATERRHESEGHKGCRSVTKFWLDGVWTKSRGTKQLLC
jgi:hypothetical protein